MGTVRDKLVHLKEDLRGIFTEAFLGDNSGDDFEGSYQENFDNIRSDSSLGHQDNGPGETTPLYLTGSLIVRCPSFIFNI